MKTKTVIKENGSRQDYDRQKIFTSIWNVASSVGGKDKTLARSLSSEVEEMLEDRYPNGELIKSQVIGELVEKVLIEHGHAKTAKAYILFRENKKHFKQDKESLGIKDDIGLSYNTLYILKRRFLKRTETGKIVETPSGLMKRVAKFLASVEETGAKKKKYEKEFYGVMSRFDFLPGTRTLANAGKTKPQLANCFVWPLEDDIDHIFEILHQSTLIKKNGGGCGYNFSNIRPEDDVVGGIPELATGPVKMIEMFDLMT
jgi:ribonucleotide reductase alpha subunit